MDKRRDTFYIAIGKRLALNDIRNDVEFYRAVVAADIGADPVLSFDRILEKIKEAHTATDRTVIDYAPEV